MIPVAALACGCGCDVFDVATSTMLPSGSGGVAYLQSAFQDQNRNYSGSSRAPASDNSDIDIRTQFLMAGVQYIFKGNWGVQLEVPFSHRFFTTTGGASGSDIV